MKTNEELIIESARGLVGSARKNPSFIDVYHGQLLGMRTVVFFVFGEGDLYREILEVINNLNSLSRKEPKP